MKKPKISSQRGWIQGLSTLLMNANLRGFLENRIYGGKLKHLCVPGLNCYSCPGALGACPIGALQAGFASKKIRFSAYVVGFLLMIGSVFGRAVCGFLCPFGWFQELLHKIPAKKIRSFHGDRWLRYLKYVILAIFVVVLPGLIRNAAGTGQPWFCKFICPAGTLEGGVFLALFNDRLRALLGGLYLWKSGILLAILVASVMIFRPFCRYICPLGAIYAFFNRVSLYRLTVDKDVCVGCGKCSHACPMQADPLLEGGAECIRCGECASVCPTAAIHCGFGKGKGQRIGNRQEDNSMYRTAKEL